MKKTRTLAIIMVLTLLVSFATSCGKNSAETLATTTSGTSTSVKETYTGYNGLPTTLPDGEIELFLWAGNTAVACETAITEFNKKYPNVKLTLTTMTATTRDENLQPRIAANQLPAIMTMAKSKLGDEMFTSGYLRELSDTRAYRSMKEYFQQAVISAGGAYNIPVADGRVVVYANMNLLKKAGITEWPTGWDAFVAMCEKLKSNNITPILLAGAHSSSITHAMVSAIVGLRIYQNNPADFDKIKKADKSFEYNGEVVVQALKDIKMLADKGYFQDGFMGTGANDAMTAMSQGQGAMFINGTWYSGQVLNAASTETDIQMQFLPFSNNGKPNTYESNTEDGWAVNAKLSDSDMEIALVMLDFFNLEGYSSVQHLRKFISVMKTDQCDMQLFPTTLKLIENSKNVEAIPHTTIAWDSSITTELSTQISAMLSGQTTPQAAADSWKSFVDKMR